MNLKLISVVIILGITVGCAHPKMKPTIISVTLPVATLVTPPAELRAPLTSELPKFVAPSDKEASSALTAEGERTFRALINDLLTRIDAWQAWAVELGKGK